MGTRYRQLTADDRNRIQTGLNAGLSRREIARGLDRWRSAVSREIARNRAGATYDAVSAGQRTRSRRRRGRRKLVANVAAWPSSSYPATVGLSSVPAWLETDWVLGQFGGDRDQAQTGYATFAAAGLEQLGVWERLRHQVLLGSDRFVEQVAGIRGPPERLREVPRAQRRPLAKPLAYFERTYPVRREAMARAFLAGVYIM